MVVVVVAVADRARARLVVKKVTGQVPGAVFGYLSSNITSISVYLVR